MKVFISWSKPLSRKVAEALHAWLPQVLQSVEPFISAADIDAGRRWSATIAGELQESNFGILCVTRENRHEPWLNFEAGALAKNLDESFVVPLLIDLTPADLEGPLAQFQAVTSLDQAGITRMLQTLNGLCEQGLSDDRLREAIEVWWPRLEPQLDAARDTSGAAPDAMPLRADRDVLEEVLTIVRRLDESQFRTPESRSASRRAVVLKEAFGANVPVLSVGERAAGVLSVTYRETPSPAERGLVEQAAAKAGFERVEHAVPNGPTDVSRSFSL